MPTFLELKKKAIWGLLALLVT
ncbi:MAG: hypothetical protein QOH35_5711, partial [Acidobacteriaceae bacterium]|nr:hypothetical protein [Acidobacteriaceae bacterium]